jgi:hypothetical protein
VHIRSPKPLNAFSRRKFHHGPLIVDCGGLGGRRPRALFSADDEIVVTPTVGAGAVEVETSAAEEVERTG